MTEPSNRDEDDLLAAELALGLLDDTERRQALVRIETDPAFRRLHARWQAHAAALVDDGEEAPPAELWDTIAGSLPANENRRPSRLRVWQAATAASLVAALALGAVALRPPAPPRPIVVRHVTLVAVLTGSGSGALAVSYDATARRLTTAPAGLKLGGSAAQLWAIAAGAKPVSLGIVPPEGAHATVASARAAAAIVGDATLAVSVEPRGGSPTGQPTGPVILTGKITAS